MNRISLLNGRISYNNRPASKASPKQLVAVWKREAVIIETNNETEEMGKK